MSDWTRDEMMTVAAARLLWDGCVCFVGIGLPSAACNLARLTHAPDVVLIYESGTRRDAAGRAAAFDRRRRTGRHRSLRHPAAGSLQLPAAGRARGRRLSRRRADRPARQPEQHRDRPLRRAEDAAARRGRRDGDRRPRQADVRDAQGHAAQPGGDSSISAPAPAFSTATARARKTTMRGTGPQSVITDYGVLTPQPADRRTATDGTFRRRHASTTPAPPPAGRCRWRQTSRRSHRRPARTRNPARLARAHPRGAQPPRAASRLTRDHFPGVHRDEPPSQD